MKKICFLSILTMLTLVSCAESKAVVSEGKSVRGDWTVSQVSVDGINESYVNAKVFDQADFKCYEGSVWHLVQNNASGYYTLHGGMDCPSETTNIKWFLTEKNGKMEFMFKKVYEGEKPKNVVDGYTLDVVNVSENMMVLKQNLSFEGKPISINYTFTK